MTAIIPIKHSNFRSHKSAVDLEFFYHEILEKTGINDDKQFNVCVNTAQQKHILALEIPRSDAEMQEHKENYVKDLCLCVYKSSYDSDVLPKNFLGICDYNKSSDEL